jgi:hypothetical protein
MDLLKLLDISGRQPGARKELATEVWAAPPTVQNGDSAAMNTWLLDGAAEARRQRWKHPEGLWTKHRTTPGEPIRHDGTPAEGRCR